MKPLLIILACLHQMIGMMFSRTLMHCYKHKFCAVGTNIIFDPLRSNFSYKNILLGSHVFIASGAWFSSDRAQIIIGSYVMIGPGVKILGGDHETKSTEVPMFLVKEKGSGLDADVKIGDDVWIGANVIILKGVKIGTGSIIASASVVNKDVEPFSIYAGVPARKLRDRFTADELTAYRAGAGKYIENF